MVKKSNNRMINTPDPEKAERKRIAASKQAALETTQEAQLQALEDKIKRKEKRMTEELHIKFRSVLYRNPFEIDENDPRGDQDATHDELMLDMQERETKLEQIYNQWLAQCCNLTLQYITKTIFFRIISR